MTRTNTLAAATAALLLGLAATLAFAASKADPLSDAPEGEPVAATAPLLDAASYEEALRRWRGAEHVNAWIGARFVYDHERALRLSETQRQQHGRLPITAPAEFFTRPAGVCVDLARFAVETLRVVDPAAKASYVMIEFDPIAIAGNTLRRHWLVAYESEGRHYFFADSKRPGFVAGPYASTREFIDEYAAYRGRRIVAFQQRDSFERRQRAAAPQRQGTHADTPAKAGPAR